jgi:hypothetical protein
MSGLGGTLRALYGLFVIPSAAARDPSHTRYRKILHGTRLVATAVEADAAAGGKLIDLGGSPI